ncbi:2OG-Fe(II) oxygenase [bacterium]|nr:2OG-Fe(II) oxygenase [Candidatus Elulimicrobium humile]
MSFDSDGSILLGKDIFLFKNFISEKQASDLFNLAISMDDSFWDNRTYHYTSNTHIKEIEPVIKKLSEKFFGDIILDDACYFQKYHLGGNMGQHQDDNKVLDQIELSKTYKDGTPYKIINQPRYGIVIYLNKVSGGELFYSKQNILYEPYPGDLVIHSAEEHCTHGVNPLKSDVRICIPTYAYSKIKVPL